MKSLQPLSRILVAVAALALISGFFTPLWQILLWAPQYPEGLSMKIWIDHLTGDINTINGLNHYIGMRHIEEAQFTEFIYLPKILMAIIAIGLAAALWGRRWGVMAFLASIAALGSWVLYDMYQWGYDYGHNLDDKAAIKVPDMTYQPPLIGYKELLNFLAYSGPDTGGWILSAVAGLLTAILIYEWKRN